MPSGTLWSSGGTVFYNDRHQNAFIRAQRAEVVGHALSLRAFCFVHTGRRYRGPSSSHAGKERPCNCPGYREKFRWGTRR